MSELSLPTDQYYIRNENTFAGRNKAEDLSLNPKAVYCPPYPEQQELWEVERLDNGRYILKIHGAPTGEIKNLLFAFINGEPGEEWIVTYRETNEKHWRLYTIEKADGSGVWVRERDAEGHHQIAVRHVIVRPSEPPQYPPNALWNIQPLVN